MGKGVIFINVKDLLKLPEGFSIDELEVNAGHISAIVESEKITEVSENEYLPVLIPKYEISEDGKQYKCNDVEIKQITWMDALANSKEARAIRERFDEILMRQATIKQ